MNKELVIEILKEAIAELQGEAPEPVLDSDPTKEEISLLISGRPDFHITDPELYEARKDTADPERKPWTDKSWFIYRWGKRKVDPRPYTDVMIDGIEYARIIPQVMGGDYYWIGKGVIDVMDKDFWLIDKRTNRNDILGNVRAYTGGLNTDPKYWPKYYRDAYLETH